MDVTIIQELIDGTRKNLNVAEINERFWQRKQITSGLQIDKDMLGRVQTEKKFYEEYLAFLEEIKKEKK